MSRVRILNLPQDCTEDMLRQHILHSATPTSPPLDITDVFIVRSGGAKRGRANSSQQGQLRHRGTQAQKRIRMAFVGFRSSAAAQFVVRHLNQTYLRSSKIAVEMAKGLGEVGVTVNMRKRAEAQQKAAESAATTRSRSTDDHAPTTTGGTHDPSAHGARGRTNNEKSKTKNDSTKKDRIGDTLNGHKHEDDKGDKEAKSTKQARRESFVSARVQSTSGPAWAAEVLLPTSSAPSETPVAPATTTTMTMTMTMASSGDKFAHAVKAKKVEDNNVASAFDEAAEQRALEKQQALGEVNDMAFLSSLSTGSGNQSDQTNKRQRIECDEEDADEARRGGACGTSAAANSDEAQTMRGSAQCTDSATDDNHSTTNNNSNTSSNNSNSRTLKNKKRTRSSSAQAESKETDEEANEEDIALESARIRVTGIPYIATEENVKQLASSCIGPVLEVHIPLTKDTKQSKGAAFVKFQHPADAVRALRELHGKIFMGRLIRVAAAVTDPYSQRALERAAQQSASATGAPGSLAGCSQLKLSKERQRREQQQQSAGGAVAALLHGNNNSSSSSSLTYMDSHAAVEAVAQRLAVRAEDVVGVQAGGAAVRAAIAEAYLAHEVQQVLGDEGIDLDCLQSAEVNLLKPRSQTTILVKNIQLSTPAEAMELTRLFVRYGVLESSAFPSAGVFALFRYAHAQDARIAFSRLSLKLFHNAPLYLEWAPIGASVDHEEKTDEDVTDAVTTETGNNMGNRNAEDARPLASSLTTPAEPVFTLFITNLPFTAETDDFHVFLQDACPRLARAPDRYVKRLVHQKEQGRAFLTLCDASTLSYCAAKLRGRSFQSRVLNCVVSKQTEQQQQQQKKTREDTSRGSDSVRESAVHPRSRAAQGDDAAAMEDDAHQNEDDDTADHTRHRVHAEEDDDDDDDDTLAKTAGVNIVAGRTKTTSAVPAGSDPNKLIVKNLPFEATVQDVRELFSAFSEIRSVRIPRKSHTFASHRENNHRGFAFVEFLSEAEAARALAMLRSTHLYGRHLVLQYAKLDAA